MDYTPFSSCLWEQTWWKGFPPLLLLSLHLCRRKHDGEGEYAPSRHVWLTPSVSHLEIVAGTATCAGIIQGNTRVWVQVSHMRPQAKSISIQQWARSDGRSGLFRKAEAFEVVTKQCGAASDKTKLKTIIYKQRKFLDSSPPPWLLSPLTKNLLAMHVNGRFCLMIMVSLS